MFEYSAQLASFGALNLHNVAKPTKKLAFFAKRARCAPLANGEDKSNFYATLGEG